MSQINYCIILFLYFFLHFDIVIVEMLHCLVPRDG